MHPPLTLVISGKALDTAAIFFIAMDPSP